MAGGILHPARLARCRTSGKVPTDISSSQAEGPQARHHEMSKVLTHTGPLLQEIRHARAQCGRARLVREVLMYPVHQLYRCLADSPIGREGRPSVVLYRRRYVDIGRWEGEVAGFPCFGVFASATGPRLLPRHVQCSRIRLVRLHVDHADRGDYQASMRLNDMEVGLGIPIEINVPEEVGRLRVDVDLMRNTALPGKVTWAQIDQTVASGDIGVVGIGGPMLDVIGRHAVPPTASSRNSG